MNKPTKDSQLPTRRPCTWLVVDVLLSAIVISVSILYYAASAGDLLLIPGMSLLFIGLFVFLLVAFIKHYNLTRSPRIALTAAATLFFPSIITFAWATKSEGAFLIKILTFPVVSLFIAVFAGIALWRNQENRVFAYRLLLLLAIVGTMLIPPFANQTLPYLYSPPAIPAGHVSVYRKAVNFVAALPEYNDITISVRNWIKIDGRAVPDHALADYFSRADILQIITIRKELKEAAVAQVRKVDGAVLFYKDADKILPAGPGVLYSLTGVNPNEIDAVVLKNGKPYVSLSGNWYISRCLSLRDHRITAQTCTPKPLIDRSLEVAISSHDDI